MGKINAAMFVTAIICASLFATIASGSKIFNKMPPEILVYAAVTALALLLILILIGLISSHIAKRKKIASLVNECEEGLDKFWPDYEKTKAELNIFKQFYPKKYWGFMQNLMELTAIKASKKNFEALKKESAKFFLSSARLESRLNDFRYESIAFAVVNLDVVAITLKKITPELDHARVESHKLIDCLPAIIKSAQATYREPPDEKLIAEVKNEFEDVFIATAGKQNEIHWLEIHKILCGVKQTLENIRTAAEERKQMVEREAEAKQTAPKRLETLLLAVEGAGNKNDSEEVKSLLADARRILSAAQILVSLEPCSWTKISKLLQAAERLYCASIDQRALDEAHASLCKNQITLQEQK